MLRIGIYYDTTVLRLWNVLEWADTTRMVDERML